MEKKIELGTVIHGTLRTDDLIKAFLMEIKRLDEKKFFELVWKSLVNNTTDEQREEFLHEELFDTLDSYAPKGYYFGAHPGDGSDFGFWESDYEW
jgi:hypothetical protein